MAIPERNTLKSVSTQLYRCRTSSIKKRQRKRFDNIILYRKCVINLQYKAETRFYSRDLQFVSFECCKIFLRVLTSLQLLKVVTVTPVTEFSLSLFAREKKSYKSN